MVMVITGISIGTSFIISENIIFFRNLFYRNKFKKLVFIQFFLPVFLNVNFWGLNDHLNLIFKWQSILKILQLQLLISTNSPSFDRVLFLTKLDFEIFLIPATCC